MTREGRTKRSGKVQSARKNGTAAMNPRQKRREGHLVLIPRRKWHRKAWPPMAFGRRIKNSAQISRQKLSQSTTQWLPGPVFFPCCWVSAMFLFSRTEINQFKITLIDHFVPNKQEKRDLQKMFQNFLFLWYFFARTANCPNCPIEVQQSAVWF